MWKMHALAYILFVVYKMFSVTWRVRVVESVSLKEALKSGEPMTIAHWHAHIPTLFCVVRHYHTASMISQSKDGELVAKILELEGCPAARGSSTRGGANALRSMLVLAEQGWRPAIAVDGPKGPRHKVKTGIFEISRVTKSKIFPVAVAADRAFVFEKAWDKTIFPKPFARITIYWGEALPAVSLEADSKSPELCQALEQALSDAQQHACNLVAARASSATVKT